LLGLAAKNAILIVEYAVLKHTRACPPRRRAGSGAPAIPSDPDDLACVHFRSTASRDLGGRRRGARGVQSVRRHGRNDGGDVPCDLFVPMFFKFITDRKLSERSTASELRSEIEREHARHEADVPHRVALKTEDGHA